MTPFARRALWNVPVGMYCAFLAMRGEYAYALAAFTLNMLGYAEATFEAGWREDAQ